MTVSSLQLTVYSLQFTVDSLQFTEDAREQIQTSSLPRRGKGSVEKNEIWFSLPRGGKASK